MSPVLVFADRNMDIFENPNNELSINETDDDYNVSEENNDDEMITKVYCMMMTIVKMKTMSM